MKYVIFGRVGFEEAVLLPPTMSHKDVVREGWKVVSAGQCTIGVNGHDVVVQAFGESVTLGVSSRPEDGEVIMRSLEMNW